MSIINAMCGRLLLRFLTAGFQVRRLCEPRRFAPKSSFRCRFARSGWVLLAALLVAHPALAEVVPQSFGGDSRIREVMYDPDEVVRLEGVVGYHLHLQFEDGESFVNLGAGDGAALEVGTEGRHLLLKPKQPAVATNLTILTSRRVYTIEYSARRGPEARPAVYAVRFWYPETKAAAAAAPEVVPSEVDRNEDYWACGAGELRPVEAWDDGVQTRLRFAARGEWPAIFVANADGSEGLVNFHVEGDVAVVHRVARKFVLRRGERVACVENRRFAGGGRSLATGTVSETVERVVPGGAP